MKRLLVIVFIIIGFGQTQAQSISVAPTSFQAVGQTKYMSTFTAGYKGIDVHYFWAYRKMECCDDLRTGEQLVDTETQSTFGISYNHVIIKNVLKAGVLLTACRFPVKKDGEYLNFILDIGYTFDNFRISYRHISNGFGLHNKINPGLDQLTVVFYFKKL